MRRFSRENPRVFVGLSEVSGYYSRIVDHLRGAGYPISFNQFSFHPFAYDHGKQLTDYPFQRELVVEQGISRTLSSVLRRRLLRFHLFLWAVRHHDVFVFSYGNSFSNSSLDLILLRLLRKRIVMFVAHGSESRPAYMDGAHWSAAIQSDDPIHTVRNIARRQCRKMRRIEVISNCVIAHPLTSQFLSRRSVNSSCIGLPVPQIHYSSREKVSSSFKIVHAPSNRRAKGSDLIRDEVLDLSRIFPEIQYKELFGISNAEVLNELATADLLIDQLYSDTVLAGVGVEAASFGVATFVCGYGFEELRSHIDSALLPPAFTSHPDVFKQSLAELLEDKEAIYAMGASAKNFVTSIWSIEQVSQRFLDVAIGHVKEEWIFDPSKISYSCGSGLPMDDLQLILHAGLVRYGDSFFQIPPRHRLIQRFLSVLR